MKKELILLLLLFLMLFQGETVRAGEPVDSLVTKSENVLNKLIAGKGTELHALMRDDLKPQLPASTLGALFSQLEVQCGKLLRQGTWKTFPVNGVDIYYKDLQFEKAPLRLLLGYETNGKLNTLRISNGEFVPDGTSEAASLFKEKDLMVQTGEYRLPGKLMLPDGKAPFPVVVLVHGSGPMDKNETIGQNKFFLDLANGLAKLGIATIRYDKRTYVYKKPVVDFNEETVDDAVSAVKLASTLPEINRQKVYILGHSLGGRMLPRFVFRCKGDIKGCIGLAASARPLQDVLVEQFAYLSKTVKGFKEENAGFVENSLKALPATYLADDKSYDAPSEARKNKMSYCFLQGGKDYNVTSTDFELWKKALPDAQFKWFPDLNHLFRVTKGVPSPNDFFKKQDISEDVIQAIADFIETGKVH